MPQTTVHVDESGAVPKIDISIINEKSVEVSIFRLEPNTFEEELVVELGSGETKTVTLWVTDCLVARSARKWSANLVSPRSYANGACPVATPRMATIVASLLKIIVQNQCGFCVRQAKMEKHC